ncbi:MAG TPA: FAD-dependent monooxygenase, partial [Acidobacteriota bacterium]|nr:FAD-dependent monooxygenase [Acidobacteriota bacterium]
MLVVICGGGPGGAVAAQKLAQSGVETILLEKNFTRIKPCGGAIPPALVREFDIPEHIIERRVQAVTVYAPSGQSVQLDTSTSFVGMVNREAFDSFLRDRAAQAGALIVEARV